MLKPDRSDRQPVEVVLSIDGSYFGHGWISRRKLTKVLDVIVAAEVSR
ncbi:MAG: hypothetical protein ACC683_02455 [Acidimicrobiia bacterium]